MLKDRLRGRRIRFSDAERALLARKAKAVGRKGFAWAVARTRQTHVVVNVAEGHWKMLSASDFLTVEVWTGRDLITYYVMFVISLADRVVTIGGITTRPGATRVWEPVRPRPRIPPQCFAAGDRRADQ